MAVDISSLSNARAPRTARTRVAALPAEAGLVALVVASFAGRFAAAIPHSTPRLFPDEYIYAQLARSIAHGRLTIRGHEAHFPALLEPVLAAPLWMFGDVESAFRLTQALHSLFASLVAVPVYLLARRLGFPAWQRLACAACALALPTLIYSSFITADALGMTLAVTAFYTGVCVLDTPTRRNQIAFVLLAGVTTLARVQYVVVFAAFAVAALVVAHGRVVRVLRRYRIAAGLIAILALAAAAIAARGLGYYDNVVSLHVGTGAARWAATDAMLFVYSSGFVLVPGALIGLALSLARPRNTLDRAFAAFATALALFLFLEASVYAANGSERFLERYLIALLPLVPISFCLACARSASRRTTIAAGVLSFAFVLVAVRAPLSSYTSSLATQDSPLLQAVRALQQAMGTGTGSLVVALGVAALAVPAVLAFARPRIGVAVALVSGAAVFLAATAGAVVTDVRYTRAVEQGLPTDLRWVDHSGAAHVSVLVAPSTPRPVVSAHLFWNTTLSRLLQMGGQADVVDSFGYSKVRVQKDGTILAGGRPVTGFLLAEEYVNAVTLDGARLVRRDRGASLWYTAEPARLRTLTYGRFPDGWLGWPYGTVTVWPRPGSARTGALCLRFSLPEVGGPVTLDLRASGYRRTVTVPSAGQAQIGIPRTIARPWVLHIVARRPFRLGSRLVSAVLDPPRFVDRKASGIACR